MKAFFIVITLCVVLVLPSAAAAVDLNLNTEVYSGFHSETSNFSVKTHRGAKATLSLGDGPFRPYLWGSLDIMETRLLGLKGAEYTILGGGIGVEYDVLKYCTVFADVGYFEPTVGNLQMQPTGGDKGKYEHIFKTEGVVYYLNEMYNGALSPTQHGGAFKYAEVEAEGDFGGEVGFRLNYPIVDWASVNLTAAYRFMRVDEAIRGYINPNVKWGYWEHKTFRELSGPRLGVGVTIKF